MLYSTLRPARILLAAAAVTLLAACDSSPAVAPTDEATADLALGTFTAQVSGARVAVSGSADMARGTDGADFTGAFQSYPIARDPSATFHLTMIQLRSGTGEGLLLGHIAPNADLPDGEYGIEPGRDLRPPFDFVARYLERDNAGVLRQIAAREGRVTVTSSPTRLGGRFELVLTYGRTVSGRFAAATRR